MNKPHKQYSEEHKAKRREYAKRRYHASQSVREYHKAANKRFAATPEYKAKARERSKAIQATPEHKAYAREYNERKYQDQEEREKQRARVRAYARTEEGKAAARKARLKREELIKAGKHRMSKEQWQEILHAQHHLCAMCGQHKPLVRDHIIPLSKGGTYEAGQIQALCAPCNSKKGTRLIDSFQQYVHVL